MKRALKRAHHRLRGGQPDWPGEEPGLAKRILYDALLCAALLAFLAGLALTAWSVVEGFEAVRLIGGLVLLAAGPVLLLWWERAVWEPFAEHLARLD
jgi:hypothetical protein